MKSSKIILFYLTLAGAACLPLVASVSATNRTWSDSTGSFRVEAAFVSLAGENVVLKRASGENVTVPLKRLSQADQAVAQQLAGGTAPSASQGSPAAASGVQIAAEGKLLRIFRSAKGKQTESQALQIELTLTGGTAAEASAVGKITAEALDVGGQRLELREGFGTEFKPIDRNAKGFFARHPKDGIRLTLNYGEVANGAGSVGPIKGSVMVMAGGTGQTVEVEDVLQHKKGPLPDPKLAKAGILASFTRQIENGKATVGVELKEAKQGAFLGINLLGADGNDINGAKVSAHSGDTVKETIGYLDVAQVAGAKLVIHFREGGEKVEIPFNVAQVAIAP